MDSRTFRPIIKAKFETAGLSSNNTWDLADMVASLFAVLRNEQSKSFEEAQELCQICIMRFVIKKYHDREVANGCTPAYAKMKCEEFKRLQGDTTSLLEDFRKLDSALRMSYWRDWWRDLCYGDRPRPQYRVVNHNLRSQSYYRAIHPDHPIFSEHTNNPGARPNTFPSGSRPRTQLHDDQPSHQDSFQDHSFENSSQQTSSEDPPRENYSTQDSPQDPPYENFSNESHHNIPIFSGKPPVSLYAVLGVTQSATKDEIKKAHRTLSLKYHPDQNHGNEKQAVEAMEMINQAKDVLGDAELRASYDRTGRFPGPGLA